MGKAWIELATDTGIGLMDACLESDVDFERACNGRLRFVERCALLKRFGVDDWRKWRLHKQLTRQELADKIGRKVENIRYAEEYGVGVLADAIADVLEISPDELRRSNGSVENK